MRLSDFILLDEQQKKLIVLHEGVLIGKRVDIDLMVFLFQMDSYYVETFCNRANKSIQEFRIFDNMEFLAPYLDAISIDELLN
jgi:hypothetical protein